MSAKRGESPTERRVAAYFAACRQENKTPTLPGLALALGMESREELERRAACPGRVGAALRLARSQVEEAQLQAMFQKDTAAGAKFLLQADFGYGGKPHPKKETGKPQETVITVEVPESHG